jgi:hypothetical protein
MSAEGRLYHAALAHGPDEREVFLREACAGDDGLLREVKSLLGYEQEAKRQQQVNEAEGEASAILAVADATAEGIRKVAEAIQKPGGYEAVQLRVAEQYIDQFGKLAKDSNTLVLPANVADVGSMLTLAMNVIRQQGGNAAPPEPR